MQSGAEVSLTRLKVSSESKEAEEIRLAQRKRNTLVLILDHLCANGYTQSVERLQEESGVQLDTWAAADNVDLLSIVQEYEGYYAIKFGRPPKLTRKHQGEKSKDARSRRKAHVPAAHSSPATGPLPKISSGKSIVAKPVKEPTHLETKSGEMTNSNHESGFDGLVGTSAVRERHADKSVKVEKSTKTNVREDSEETLYENRLLKPMPDYGIEFRELASIISRDIFITSPSTPFASISGLTTAKRLVKEAVVYPLRYPSLFQGILTPWRGILLYGPPGTGKTMLAKAVATECKTTFFNISASSIVSKWRGDSEKLVRVLFELARYHAPSTIFLDELESLMSHRTTSSDHEGSRRMKTELLIQLDGLSKHSDSHIFLLAASNLPWDLDHAMLRRLEKRIFIDLPDFEARKAMLMTNLPYNMDQTQDGLLVEKLDYDLVAKQTEGYSGSDIKLVCKEAAMRPLRAVFKGLDIDSGLPEKITRQPVRQSDLEAAISTTKPSSSKALGDTYRKWQEEFGSY
ncbi:P-loop containing nucleoside triphosphate hydrolase protein [Gaertneriomyces semiglobifer]|nr:P-loop containing nucleoside triphosphate hydrolase protein [Gaertneriomyces semiglobifer]